MIPYADTNIFLNVLIQSKYTREARELVDVTRKPGAFALPVTLLLKMEFANGLRRTLFEAQQGKLDERFTRELLVIVEHTFAEELALGKRWVEAPVSFPSLFPQFEALSHRFTPEYGFRTYDILHVASALVLGCDTFWSFDQKARKLAQLQGLKTN